MSVEEDTTQPIEAPALHTEPTTAFNPHGATGETSIQAATLPSTAIGGHTDTNKLGAQEIDVAPAAPLVAALPMLQPQQAIPEYHKPFMSQGEGTLFDDPALFGASIAPASPPAALSSSPPPLPPQDPPTHAPAEDEPHEPVAKPSSVESSPIPPTASEPAPEAIASPEIHDAKPAEQIEAPTSGESVEEAPKMQEEANEPVLDESHAESLDSSVEMSERERELANMQEEIRAAQEERLTTKASAPQAAPRSTRQRRPVSYSQGVAYDYSGTGTLQHDSEDEDGGWDSEDEERATQLLTAPQLDFEDEDERDVKQSKGEASDTDDEEPPPPKKRKEAETDDSARHVAHSADDNDDVEITAAYSGKYSEPTTMEDEIDGPVSKPRPSLGQVGTTSKPEASSTSKKAKSAAPSKRSAASTSTAEHDSSPSNTPTKSSTPSKSSASKKTSATAIAKESEGDEPGESPAKKSLASRSTSTPTASQSSNTASPKEPIQRRSSRFGLEHEQDLEPRSRVRRARTPSTGPKPRASTDGTKVKVPSEEVARALLKNARQEIAKYLAHTEKEKDDGDDMKHFFTQRHVSAPVPASGKLAEVPTNMLKRFSFIVTGLRSTSEPASSATFIKTQIKALGGTMLNFRTSTRRKTRRTDRNAHMEDFEVDFPQTILLSEKPQRTLKYITALVNGVPCVHYKWLLACVYGGKLLPLDEYLLPAGYNEDSALVPTPDWFTKEDQEDVPFYERYPFYFQEEDDTDDEDGENSNAMDVDAPKKTKRAKPLLTHRTHKKKGKSKKVDNYRVEVIGIPAFRQQWSAILKQAGANIVERLDAANVSYGTLDFVLSDSEPTDLHLQLATARGLPLCTIDWALQSIIQRQVQDPLSKPAYTLQTEGT